MYIHDFTTTGIQFMHTVFISFIICILLILFNDIYKIVTIPKIFTQTRSTIPLKVFQNHLFT